MKLSFKKNLKTNHVTVLWLFGYIFGNKGFNGSVLVDPSSVNYAIVSNLQAKPVFKESPIILWKALKNDTELKCTKWRILKMVLPLLNSCIG